MPTLSRWPEWIKAVLTAAFASIVTVFGMGFRDGARQAKAEAVEKLVESHEPRIQVLEQTRAGDIEWKVAVRAQLERIEKAVAK